MIRVVTGIDDIGTMGAKSEGWTLFSFSESLLEEFVNKAQEVLSESKLKSFHGKEFKRKKIHFYKEFLSLVRFILEKDHNSFICCTLSDEEWKESFREFCENCICGALQDSGITDEKFIESSTKLALPLFTYMRKSSQLIKADLTNIHLDSDSMLKRISSTELLVNNKEVSPNDVIFSSLNTYRKLRFSDAPEITRGGIHVLNDEDSFVIQAADMFGNFSTAYAAKELGYDSKTNNLKAGAFFDVFGDLIDSSKLKDMVELIDNEVSLKDSGAFNFTIS